MKTKTNLTPEQKTFIQNNFRHMTYEEMTIELNLKSRYKVQEFCNIHGLVKPKKKLNDVQKDFIRNNFFTMRETDMMEVLGVPRTTIQQFKREEGLIKYPSNVQKSQKEETETLCFNVNARENWLY